MESTELAANLFRTTQTEEKLRRDKVKGKDQAHRTHFEVGAKVRKTIEELVGFNTRFVSARAFSGAFKLCLYR